MITPSNPNGALTPGSGGAVPSLLGIWRVGDRIASGKSAQLHLAQPADSVGNPRWDYLIKFAPLDSQGPARHEANRRIAASYEAGKETSHAQLVSTRDGSPTGPTPFVVMSRLQGETLQDMLLRQVAIPLPQVLWIARQITGATAALHQAGWIHGEIHPGAIFMDRGGQACLLDLGSATRFHSQIRVAYRGDEAFASHERRSTDIAALPGMDAFALGQLLWTLLTYNDTQDETVLGPIADLVGELLDPDPQVRPDAKSSERRLLDMELSALSHHIGPAAVATQRRSAA
ncbi:MAG: hypothetical protein AAGD07_22090 [Planctomycetota bacterium]